MDVKFKIGDGKPSTVEAGSIIIDKTGKKLYIDTTNAEEGRIQIGGGVSDPSGEFIEKVELIPLTITENDITTEYYLLAIPNRKKKNNWHFKKFLI